MKKHRFNIFPEASQEDFDRLVQDIDQNGYDHKFPVVLKDMEILDGWNRYRACEKLGIQAPKVMFTGSDSEAIAYMMRTNKRRNLNKGQWATIAVEAEDIMAALSNAARARQGTRSDLTSDKKLSQVKKREHGEKTATKAAELFNTNRTYINQAAKVKVRLPRRLRRSRPARCACRMR
jgi:hypothetical protein